MARGKAVAESLQPARLSVDWKYTLFYVLFYICLIFIALFGVIAET